MSPPSPDTNKPSTQQRLRTLAAQPEAAGGGPEPGLGQGPGQGAVEHGLAVGLLDRQPAQGAVADGQGGGVGRPPQPLLVVGEGEQGPAAALHVQDQVAVDQDHHRPGLAARPVPGPLAGAAGGGPARPGRGGPGARSRCASRVLPAAVRSGQARAAPYGLAGSAAASTWVWGEDGGSVRARRRSTAPGTANWAPPRPSTK